MKNKLLLTVALGLAGAAPLMTSAATVDVYITGSTAFRANCYTACSKLYSPAPVITYADAAHGGSAAPFSSKTASWVMTGTPASTLTALSGDTLVIHGLFTGSIQGAQAVENSQLLTWAAPGAANGANAAGYVNNSPTINFSDADVDSTSFVYDPSKFNQEEVCVQPFVVAKSQGGAAVTNVNNVSWEQLEYGIPNGRIPLSAWTYKLSDTNTYIYLVQRTKDSGTRRTETAAEYYQFNDAVGIYCYDATNNFWYVPTSTNNQFAGFAPYGVIGTEGPGLANANLAWGFGYIGGGDIASELNVANPANEAIAVLSISDSKSVGPSGVNWSNVISFNGFWPTLAAAGIHATTGTNDFSPITLGYYPLWGYEVIEYPIDPSKVTAGDQDISSTELGTQTTPGTFLGVFNSQTLINGGSPIVGSIENEIDLSKVPSGSPAAGATAIPLVDMVANRANVGGLISPF